jgi:SAM-dependent methyltransferase
MERIGYDGYGDEKRSGRILRMFGRHATQVAFPWLDHGAGDSWLREMLWRSHQGNGQLYQSDIDLNWKCYTVPDGHFKTITSFEVLEHLMNPLFAMRELRRVLHAEGRLYLTTPNDYSLMYKAEHLLSRKYRPHFHQFSETDLRDLMEDAGFIIETLFRFRRSRSGTIAWISRNSFFVVAK